MTAIASRHARVTILLAAAVAQLAAWTSAFTAPLMAISVVCVGVLLPAGLGMVRRAAAAATLFVAAMVAVATMLAPTGWAFHPRLLGSILLAVFATAACGWGDWRHGPVMVPGDGPALLAAAITFAFVAGPVLFGGPADIIRDLSFGLDNANHLNITRAVQRAQRMVYDHPPTGLTIGSNVYPQGFAVGAGYTTWLARGGEGMPATATFLRDTVLFMNVLFASLAYFGALLASVMLQRVARPAALRRAGNLSGLAVVAFVAVGPAIVLHGFGFQIHILAIAAIVALLWVLCDQALAARPMSVAVFAGAATLMVAHSWYLLLPVPAAVALTWLARKGLAFGLRVIPLMLLTGVLSAFPIVNGPSPGHSSVEGAVVRPSMLAIGALVAVGFLGWRQHHMFRVAGSAGYPAIAVAASGATSLLLAAYQVMTTGELSYYFWKFLYLPLLLLAVLAAVVVASTPPRGDRPPIALYLTVVAWLLTAGPAARFALDVPSQPDVRGDVIAVSAAMFPDGAPGNTDVVASRCDVDEAKYTSWWLGGLLLDWTPERLQLQEGESLSVDDAREYAREHPEVRVVAFVDPACADTGAVSGPDNLDLHGS